MADQLTIAHGTPGTVLMAAAGRAVAQSVAVRWARRPVLVLAGPGKNGGDGYVAARLLADRGWPVTVAALGDPDRLTGDAAWARGGWGGPIRPVDQVDVPTGGLVIDALFGAGLTRALDGSAAKILQAVRAAAVPVVAVDVPSGVHGDTGAAWGPVCPATVTVTFFRLKPGHLLLPGRTLCGDRVLADIGMNPSVLSQVAPKGARAHPSLWQSTWPHPPAVDAHKYHRGHGAVWAGATMAGAARLAAMAARRIGLGLVTVLAAPAVRAEITSTAPGLMVKDAAAWDAFIEDPRRTVVVIGPGGGTGDETRAAVLQALAAGKNAVLDADALTAFAPDPDTLFDAIVPSAGTVILTPHVGEFARLFGAGDVDRVGADRVGPDRLGVVRDAARRSGAIVLLKGPDTVVAAPDGRAVINVGAPARLATAGSGDVLAGMIAGLIGQGMPGLEAAAAAAWLHGQAAQTIPDGLIAEDLIEAIPAVLPRARSSAMV